MEGLRKMRTQYCRQHIKKTAQECGLGEDIVTEVEKADKFCLSNPAFADCATRPIYRLISEKDIEVRNKAISFAENALNEETPTGGKVRERLTEPEMIVFLRKARREVHGEPGEKEKSRKKPLTRPEPGDANHGKFCSQPGSLPVTDAPPQPSLGEQVRAAEMAAAAANQPQAPATMEPAWSTATCQTGPCPDGKSHASFDGVRGQCCDLSGYPLKQIDHCPIIDRRQKAAALGFNLGGAKVVECSVTGATFTIPPPPKIKKTKLTDQERADCADALIERTSFTDHDIRQIDELVRARYDGLKDRYDLIERAVMQFLAQTEGA